VERVHGSRDEDADDEDDAQRVDHDTARTVHHACGRDLVSVFRLPLSGDVTRDHKPSRTRWRSNAGLETGRDRNFRGPIYKISHELS